MNTRTPKLAAFVACSVLMLATGCGQSSVSNEPVTTTSAAPASSSGPPAPPAPAAATITIENYQFSDATVAPGGQVTVENLDRDAHTVTSNTAGAFDVTVSGQSKVVFTAPAKPGQYPFHCTYHASMHGMLTVQ
ncbi:MAG TPA: cupredoxin domain-containing protein [Mycobacterium sp.]|nr:cupredoxin domain-containing protein [Mycobacterium sp.]